MLRRIGGLPAGRGASPWTLIESRRVIATVASITFNNIPQSYRHLLLKVRLRSDRSASPYDQINLRFNGDTGSNYGMQQMDAAGASASNSQSLSATSIAVVRCSGPTAAANSFTAGEIWVEFYAEIDSHKSARGHSIVGSDVAGYAVFDGGQWRNTAAISSITLLSGTGSNFVTGCLVDLIGVTYS